MDFIISTRIILKPFTSSVTTLQLHNIYLEHILTIDMFKSIERGLEVVQCLPHVTLGCEHYSFQTIICVRNL